MENVEKKLKWYQNGKSIFVGFLVIGPLVLPLVWKHPKYSFNKKLVLTGIILLATAGIIWGLKDALNSIADYYKEALFTYQ